MDLSETWLIARQLQSENNKYKNHFLSRCAHEATRVKLYGAASNECKRSLLDWI